MNVNQSLRSAKGELGSALLRNLADAVKAAGGEVLPAAGGGVQMSLGRRRFAIELREAREPRRELLQALLADAILRGRARGGSRGRVIAVVGAPLVSEAMARSIEEYAREVAPDQPFGYVDGRGLVRLFGPGLDGVRGEAARRGTTGGADAQPRDLFSDRNQWLLKALVGRKLPESMIAVPRGPARSAAEIAAQADISAPAAWRVFAALRADGFLDDDGEVVRARDLLTRWRAAALRPQRQIGAVWIMPGRKPLERLQQSLAEQPDGRKPDAALGLFAACDALGVGHVRGAPAHIYVRDLEGERLDRLGLALAPRGQAADVQLRVARWPESVFRAAVRADGVPVADIIQCWLDVSAEPTRGAEQASFIWRRILGPAIGGGGAEP